MAKKCQNFTSETKYENRIQLFITNRQWKRERRTKSAFQDQVPFLINGKSNRTTVVVF